MKYAYIIISVASVAILISFLFLSKKEGGPLSKIIPIFPTPTLTNEQKKNLEIEKYVSSSIKAMSLEEKVGQLFMWGVGENKLSAYSKKLLADIHAGGVILMGSRTKNNLTEITKDIKASDIKVPMFIAIDQEGGPVKRLTDDQNPGAYVLGQMDDNSFCEYEKNTDRLLSEAGVNVNFGIVSDVGWYKNSFIKNRTFSDNAETVTQKVEMAIKCSPNTLTSVKHFPGHGRTLANSHNSVPVVDIEENEWEKTDLLPFKKAIENNVDMIMLGHLLYSKISSSPATLSEYYPEKLRKLGYKGIIITDDLRMLENMGFETYDTVAQALLSGNDIVLIIGSKRKFEDIYSYALELVKDGGLKEKEIDERLERILRIKYKLTVIQNPTQSSDSAKIADYVVITETPVPTPTFTPTPTPKPIPVFTGDLEAIFTKYSNQYSVNRDLLKKIANCESHFNSGSVNGPYGGMFQFHEGTWINVRRIMNENTDPRLRFNAEEAIKTAAYKISVSGVGSWPSCSK